MEPRSTPSPQAVRDQLEKILASAPFAASTRSQRFLRYVVESSLGKEPGNGEESVKEYAIAVDVFDRDASYDPSIDATVRVEAGRLRARLREYYDEMGRNDPILIAMPKGAYRATLNRGQRIRSQVTHLLGPSRRLRQQPRLHPIPHPVDAV